MIPQILATIWLTLTWSFLITQLKKEGHDTPDAVAGAIIIIGILVTILYYGNFWCAT
jgi:hypothetical protein